MINQNEGRIQRVIPNEGRGAVKWTIQSWGGEGSDEVVFTSTNEADTVAAAEFDDMAIEAAKTYGWGDDGVQHKLKKDAPKLVYFGGQVGKSSDYACACAIPDILPPCTLARIVSGAHIAHLSPRS